MKQDQKQTNHTANPMAFGIVGGILISLLVATVVSLTTQNNEIWGWAIPLGVAVGTAIGAGVQNKQSTEKTMK